MTIKDLAAQTGYAVGTVSRVLNNQPNVSAKAREIILQAAKDAGFQLNANAKQLKQQHRKSIVVVVKGTSNELFFELVEAIQSQFSQTKYPLIVDYVDEDSNEVARGAQLCFEKKPLGILFLGGNHINFITDFEKIDVPCVLVTNCASQLNFPSLSSVFTDDFQAALCAMKSLIALGHKKIAVIGGDIDYSDISRLRFNGCVQALYDHNIPFDEDRAYRAVRFSYQDGYDATRNLLASGWRFTALFAVADVIAIGAIRALWDNGLQVPEDVSVMGFDGLPLGNFLVPQLSTVNQSISLIAKRSVEILIDCIENDAPARHETIPFAINQRESTRCI